MIAPAFDRPLPHRHRLVPMRTRLKNQLQSLAMSEGLCRKRRLWSAPGQADEVGTVERSPGATCSR